MTRRSGAGLGRRAVVSTYGRLVLAPVFWFRPPCRGACIWALSTGTFLKTPQNIQTQNIAKVRMVPTYGRLVLAPVFWFRPPCRGACIWALSTGTFLNFLKRPHPSYGRVEVELVSAAVPWCQHMGATYWHVASKVLRLVQSHKMGRVLFAWCVVAPKFSASVELLLLPPLEVTDAIIHKRLRVIESARDYWPGQMFAKCLQGPVVLGDDFGPKLSARSFEFVH